MGMKMGVNSILGGSLPDPSEGPPLGNFHFILPKKSGGEAGHIWWGSGKPYEVLGIEPELTTSQGVSLTPRSVSPAPRKVLSFERGTRVPANIHQGLMQRGEVQRGSHLGDGHLGVIWGMFIWEMAIWETVIGDTVMQLLPSPHHGAPTD